MEREKLIHLDGRDRRGRFASGPGNTGKPRGAKHKYPTPKQLRAQIIEAMEAMGGRHGIRGFLTKKLPPAVLFNAAVRLEAADIGKPLPSPEEDKVFRSVEEVLCDMDARGMTPHMLRHQADLLEEYQTAKRAGEHGTPINGINGHGRSLNGQTKGTGNGRATC